MAAFTKLEDSPMFRKQVPAPALPVSAHEGSRIRLPRMHCFVFLRISAVSTPLHGFGSNRICGMEGFEPLPEFGCLWAEMGRIWIILCEGDLD